MSRPNLNISHFEVYVLDLQKMEQFYTQILGFIVTDQGKGSERLVFLSCHPEEHHQVVFNPNPKKKDGTNKLNHLAFRVTTLNELRAFYSRLSQVENCSLETVSHGTTWSLYFLDPEKNRLEIFMDTPWYVKQPLRFQIDLNVTDEELFRRTEEKIRELPGFRTLDRWYEENRRKL